MRSPTCYGGLNRFNNSNTLVEQARLDATTILEKGNRYARVDKQSHLCHGIRFHLCSCLRCDFRTATMPKISRARTCNPVDRAPCLPRLSAERGPFKSSANPVGDLDTHIPERGSRGKAKRLSMPLGKRFLAANCLKHDDQAHGGRQ